MATGVLPAGPTDESIDTVSEHRALAWTAAAAVAAIFWLLRPVALGILLGTLLVFVAQPVAVRLTTWIGARWAVLTTVLASGLALAAAVGGLGWLFVSRGTLLSSDRVSSRARSRRSASGSQGFRSRSSSER
jgi:predicted PurR-regulated permease PerM